METNMYETYEFIPASNNSQTQSVGSAGQSGSEPEQYFVVQDDGTFLINRQVQYVTQVQDVKEALQNVYDVAGQQYFVGVDNPPQLISMPEHFVLPHESASSNYENSYLLQQAQDPQPSTVQLPERMECSVIEEEHANTKSEDDTINYVQGHENSDMTEITLNDEQCRMLEEKGWVLLELSEKIFLLNALGLHDITGNEKLIEVLKNESQELTTDNIPTTTVIRDVQSDEISEVKQNSVAEENKTEETSTIQLIFNEKNIQISSEKQSFVIQSTEPEIPIEHMSHETLMENEKNEEIKNHITAEQIDKNQFELKLPAAKKNCTVIRLKTNYALKDIPNKIFLGKTVNGKRLVAKVVDIKKGIKQTCSNKTDLNTDDDNSKTMTPKTNTSKEVLNIKYYRMEDVEKLIERTINGTAEIACSAEDLSAAETIVNQLLNVPATRGPLIGRNLIITKIVKTMDSSDVLVSESSVTLVTGRVAQFQDSGDEWHFIYVPLLLQKLARNNANDLNFDMSVSGVPIRRICEKSREDYLLHVHVVEMKYPNAPSKTSITFTKRSLIPQMVGMKQVQGQGCLQACSACAMVFRTESELLAHLELHRSEAEDEKPPLIIDTDKLCKDTQQDTNQSFAKNGSKQNTDKENRELFKCKMCSSSYRHVSSLSKHIVAQHINANVNLMTLTNKV